MITKKMGKEVEKVSTKKAEKTRKTEKSKAVRVIDE